MRLFKIVENLALAISEIKYNLATTPLALIKFIFQIPTTSQEWLNKSKVFNDVWNFRHCIGAIDGKHSTVVLNFITINRHLT